MNSLPTGPEPTWTTTGVPASSRHVPGRLEQRVVEPELPHLGVQLEHLDAGVNERLDGRADVRLGVERRRAQALGHAARRSSAAQSLRYAGDAGLVRVGQRAEPAYAERAQLLDPLLVAARGSGSASARPIFGPASSNCRHTAAWMFARQEVHVHVEQPGQAERLPPGRDALTLVLVLVLGGTWGCCALSSATGPAHSRPLSRRPIACCFSRSSWRSRRAWRLSQDFLPLASAISTLARPSLKYSESGHDRVALLAGLALDLVDLRHG